MKKVRSLIAVSLIISFLIVGSAFSRDLIRADIKSERVPAGTMLDVRMETPVNSFNYFEGDSFRSTLLEDVRIGNLIVLPAGTLLRGRVGYVKPAGRFCKDGELSLSFDHAVTPFGKQIPLVVKTTKARNLNTEGVFSNGGGYLKALDRNFDKGTDFLTASTKYSVDKGLSFWGGLPVIVTGPVGIFAGALGGGGYFVGKSVYDMFKKGEDFKINPGDVIEVTLIEPLDVPTN